ncbi:hypothetical protein GGR55DRAFT_523577 [Xylaria sp. FL0064]|nr:hypothetical protein GGR55DRAFT_523577 [Xylaria sp. FL0064]
MTCDQIPLTSPALRLPIELLFLISTYLDSPADLSSWSRSCRGFHLALRPLLYRHVKDDAAVLCWACDEGRLETVSHLLNAGANANVAWVQGEPRWWTLADLHDKADETGEQRTTSESPHGQDMLASTSARMSLSGSCHTLASMISCSITSTTTTMTPTTPSLD